MAHPPADAPVAALGTVAPRLAKPLPSGTLLDNYELQGALASDGASITYLATDLELDITVQVMEYLPTPLAQRDANGVVGPVEERHAVAYKRGLLAFVDEARLLARCDHPSLVKVVRLWESQGTVYRVMPHREGISLLQARREMAGPPAEEALRALLDHLLGALGAIHGTGRAHGGVRPEQILLLADDLPLLLGPQLAGRELAAVVADGSVADLPPTFRPSDRTTASPAGPPDTWVDLCALGEVARFCISGEAAAPGSARRLNAIPESFDAMLRRRYGNDARIRYSVPLLRALDAATSVRPQDGPASAAQLREWLVVGPPPRDPLPSNGAKGPLAPDFIDRIAPVQAGGSPPLGGSQRADRAVTAGERRDTRAPNIDPAPADGPARERTDPFLAAAPVMPPDRSASGVAKSAGAVQGESAPDLDDGVEGVPPVSRGAMGAKRPQLVVGALVTIAIVAVAAWALWQWQDAPDHLSVQQAEVGGSADAARAQRDTATAMALQRSAEVLARVGAGSAAAEVAEPSDAPSRAAADRTVSPGASVAASAVYRLPAPVSPGTAGEASEATSATSMERATRDVSRPSAPVPKDAVPALALDGNAAANAAKTSPPERKSVSRSAVPPPAATAAQSVAGSPRAVCGERTPFALYRCMQTQCALARWQKHAQCERLRETDQVE